MLKLIQVASSYRVETKSAHNLHTICTQSRERLNLPFSNLVHKYILGSKGTLLILESLGQRSRSLGSNLKNVFDQLLENALTYHLHLVHTSILCSRGTLFWGYLVKCQGYTNQMYLICCYWVIETIEAYVCF